MTISIIGAGAFGMALGIALARDGRDVTLWARNPTAAAHMTQARENTAKLPDIAFPPSLRVTSDMAEACESDILLMSVPMQQLRGVVQTHADELRDKALVACCKGIDVYSLQSPSMTIANHVPDATVAALTGPSFAADIARGLPTALTLACEDPEKGQELQELLSTQSLRLYRTTDILGAEFGGALKNVIAIACGACIGAGLGDSARAALMTRGFGEMVRFATHLGAKPETLSGLSGLGDLALTCTSELSRNYRYGLALGRGEGFDPSVTVEGAKTAIAVTKLALEREIDIPIS